MKKKRIFAAALAGLMLASLFAGCSSNNTGGGDTGNDSSGDTINLRYWGYSRWKGLTGTEENGEFGDWEKKVAEDYMKEHSNVKIEYENLPWNGGPEKVEVAIASKTQPDVLEDGTLRGFGYAGQGVLLTFDDELTEEERADIIDTEWDQVEYTDGTHIAMPWGNMAGFLVINKTLFEKAGAADLLPTEGDRSWTFDEFEKALAAVSKDGVYGMALVAGNEQGDAKGMNLLRGFGASILSPDGSKATLNTPEGVKALEWMASLIDKGYAMPGAETITAPDAIDYFSQQKIAIMDGASTGNIAEFEQRMERGESEEFEITWALTPTDGTHEGGFNANPVCVMAFKSGDEAREKAAIDFTKFVTSGENAKAVQYAKLMPTRKSASDLYEGDEIMTWSSEIMKYGVDPGFISPAYSKIRAVLYPELQALYTKAKTPERVAADFDTAAQAEIDKSK